MAANTDLEKQGSETVSALSSQGCTLLCFHLGSSGEFGRRSDGAVLICLGSQRCRFQSWAKIAHPGCWLWVGEDFDKWVTGVERGAWMGIVSKKGGAWKDMEENVR